VADFFEKVLAPIISAAIFAALNKKQDLPAQVLKLVDKPL